MEVRQATRGDLMEIARVAHQSVLAACEGLLKSSTITATLDDEYSPSALSRRLLEGALAVAVAPEGTMVGFAESAVTDERVSVRIHAASKTARRAIWVRDLVNVVRARYPDRPLCADVLLGNFAGERSCEVAGFVPGEVIQRTLFGEEIVERRWWCPLAE
ncbi:MAG: hypothetical protein MUP76_03440 [Acidimicrobiia bacterium]|nr:hypothetical protein [Acidimicrobiia bacterium]